MALAIRVSASSLEAEKAVELFPMPRKTPWGIDYDVTADGQRVLVIEPAAREGEPLTVLINWQESLKGK